MAAQSTGGFQISIGSESDARAWLERVQEINQKYNVAMEGAGQTVQEMNQLAEGTLIDDYVNLGDSLITAAHEIFNGVEVIADTVTEVLGAVGNFIDDAKEALGNTLGAIFGR